LNRKKDGATAFQATEGNEPPGPSVATVDVLENQLREQNDKYLRLMAEFDNYKKRTSRDFDRLIASANEKLISEFIEVRESLERAVKAAEECGDAKTLAEGMKLIFSKFEEVLSRNGLKPFGAAGEPFDPQLHDALMKTADETVPEDHIVEIFEKGYTLNTRVIRHARVVVSSGRGTNASGDEKKQEHSS